MEQKIPRIKTDVRIKSVGKKKVPKRTPILFLGSLSELVEVTNSNYEVASVNFVRTARYPLDEVESNMKGALIKQCYDGVIHYQLIPCYNVPNITMYLAQGQPVKRVNVLRTAEDYS